MFQKTAKDVHRAIELWANEQKSETTSDPVAVATTFRDNYERIGADTPPRGNTFCESARRRQDECVAEIARLPRHRGPAGGRINTDELRMLIGRLKYGKAAGIDAITTDLLKVCADNSALLEALCELFNRALTTSRCPAEWALAFVVPLFKKGCPYSWTNYRCISLLSVGTSAQNETPFGLSPASIFGRSNVDHAQRYVPLLWSRLRDDYTYYF